jgi:hypothetical protein
MTLLSAGSSRVLLPSGKAGEDRLACARKVVNQKHREQQESYCRRIEGQ